MKPLALHDFPVGVWVESRNHLALRDALYVGIYNVSLNHTSPIDFVPSFEHEASSRVQLPDDVDDVKTTTEACGLALAMSQYAVTPDERVSARADASRYPPR